MLHLTNLYYARQGAFEAFVLLGRGGGGTFALLFWLGFVALGSVLPFALLLGVAEEGRKRLVRRSA